MVIGLICKCGKIWEYKGQKKHYATCPDCMKRVKIIKPQINPELKKELFKI